MSRAPQASVADHSRQPPQYRESDGAPTWVTRATNFVVAITRVASGTTLNSTGVQDEQIVLLPDTGAAIRAGQESVAVSGYSLVIVPPGDATLVAAAEGWIVRCFTARHAPMLALAGNAADFAEPATRIAPLEDWPMPVGGFALRHYDLATALRDGDTTRCFRTSTMMINVLRERDGPRDATRLSPHAHVDFEQASISLHGTQVHHLRVPWGADMTRWVPDETVVVGSPSVTVIPPPLIHTTRNTGGPGWLIDLFCPPRADFARRTGMVRNADDYPLPSFLADNAANPTCTGIG